MGCAGGEGGAGQEGRGGLRTWRPGDAVPGCLGRGGGRSRQGDRGRTPGTAREWARGHRDGSHCPCVSPLAEPVKKKVPLSVLGPCGQQKLEPRAKPWPRRLI